jgi:hypothetical protein
MSVDERLRAAYHRDAASTPPPVAVAGPYDAVLAGSLRRRRQRVLAGTSLLALAAAVVAVTSLGAGRTHEAPGPAPLGPAVTVTPPDTGLAPEGFQGTWRSQPLTRELVVDGLREAGLGAHGQAYVRTVLPEGRFRVRMVVTGDVVTSRVGRLPAQRLYVVSAPRNQVELRPANVRTGGSYFVLALYGDRMTLHFQATDVDPALDGRSFPPEVYDVATFTLTAFTRVG